MSVRKYKVSVSGGPFIQSLEQSALRDLFRDPTVKSICQL